MARAHGWNGAAAGLLLTLATAQAAAARPVVVSAVPTDGAARVEGAAEVGIWAMANGTPGQHVAGGERLPARVSLEPGRYRVMVRIQGARRVVDRTLAPGETPERWRIGLDAGHVRLELRAEPGRTPVDSRLRWRVNRYKRGGDAGELVAEATAARPRLLLDAGWYEVTVTHAGSEHDHIIQVAPGEDVTYTVMAGEGS